MLYVTPCSLIASATSQSHYMSQLFIDQPVSVGYSSGELGAKNELEAVDQTFGFLVNFCAFVQTAH